MPIAAPENPLGASGAFSRKLSVRRDTYQLIFTGASPRSSPRSIYCRARPLFERRKSSRIKNGPLDRHRVILLRISILQVS